jgi:hypothetical protein
MTHCLVAGQVLRDRGRHLVAWNHAGRWHGLALHRQTAALHRSHLVLPPREARQRLGAFAGGARWIVDTSRPIPISDAATLVCDADPSLVGQIRAVVARAEASASCERFWDQRVAFA